jgi:hypothetical protein
MPLETHHSGRPRRPAFGADGVGGAGSPQERSRGHIGSLICEHNTVQNGSCCKVEQSRHGESSAFVAGHHSGRLQFPGRL